MSIDPPKTTVRQTRYVQANRELIRDPAVVEEFDRLAAFLLGSMQGMGQREVERDLDRGQDRLPTFEFERSPLDYDGFILTVNAARAGAYAAAIAAGLTTGQATAAADAAEADLRGKQATPTTAPPPYGPLGPDPGNPAVFMLEQTVAFPFSVSFDGADTGTFTVVSVVPPSTYAGFTFASCVWVITTCSIPPSGDPTAAGVTCELLITGTTGLGLVLRDAAAVPGQDYSLIPVDGGLLDAGRDLVLLGSVSNLGTATVAGTVTITMVRL